MLRISSQTNIDRALLPQLNQDGSRNDLTDAAAGEEPDGLIGRLALGEEGLGRVLGKGQGHDGDDARPHYQTLGPQPHEPHEGAKGVHDVGVVGARLLDHAAQLGIAVGAHHGEDAGEDPDDEGHVDGPRA